MTIWVVMGTTGEYSDRNEWAVAAYRDKAKAEEHIEAATQEANWYFASVARYHWDPKPETNPFDSKIQMDYTGTSYFHYEVELL